MAEAIRNAVAEHPAEAGERQEYWKPIDVQRNAALPSDACMTCGTEYPIGARYCYVCGSDRSTGADEPRPSRLKMGFTRALDLDVLKATLGLPVGSLVAFFIGMVCIIAAAAVGFMYTATTMLDW